MLNRRTFVSLAAAATASAAARPAFGQTLTKMTVAIALSDGTKALLWGIKAGIFKKYGLDIEPIALASGAADLAALAGGSAQVAFGNIISIAAGHTRGVPFEIVAPGDIYTTDRPYMLLFAKNDSDIHTGKDLNGKAIAGPALKDLTTMATLAWIDQTGGDSKTVKALEFPASAAMGALDAGRVDAATLSSPFLDAAQDSGKYRVIGKPYDAIAKRFVIASWVANAPDVKANQAMYDHFSQAFRESSIYTNGHMAETVDLMAQFTKVDPQVIAHATRILDAEYLAKSDIQPVIDFAARYGLIDRSFDAETIISPAIRPPR